MDEMSSLEIGLEKGTSEPDLVFLRWRGRKPSPRRPNEATKLFQQSWGLEVEGSCNFNEKKFNLAIESLAGTQHLHKTLIFISSKF